MQAIRCTHCADCTVDTKLANLGTKATSTNLLCAMMADIEALPFRDEEEALIMLDELISDELMELSLGGPGGPGGPTKLHGLQEVEADIEVLVLNIAIIMLDTNGSSMILKILAITNNLTISQNFINAKNLNFMSINNRNFSTLNALI